MPVSLDLETALIDRGLAAPPPVSATLNQDLLLIRDAEPHIRAAIEGNELIIGAFIAFDMAVISETWPDLIAAVFNKYRRGEIRDIILDQKIIDIATRGSADEISLEDLCVRYGLEPVDKSGPWRKEFWALRNVPVEDWPAGAVAYCLADSDRPLQVHAKQEAYAKAWEAKCSQPLLHLSGKEAYKQFALYLMTCWGFHTSGPRTAKLRKRVDRYLRAAGYWLKRKGLVREDRSRDTKAAKELMLATMGPRTHRTKTGEVCLDKEACEESGSGILQLYSEYSQSTQLLSRVEDLEAGVTLPLQARFNSLLETSRTSGSKPKPPLRGTQPQNFPKAAGARECLEPRPGYVFIVADLPMAELHSLSGTCLDLFGYSVMADQLNAGKDLHCWFGAKIVGETYETVLAGKNGPFKKVRGQAKPCNFGFPGGLGVDSFTNFAWSSYRVRFERQKAQDLKDLWTKEAFPEMREYFGWVNKTLRGRDRALFQCVGTKRWIGRRTYCQACNLQFQERTATGASDGLAEVQRRAYSVKSSDLYGCRSILYTHDEIVAEAPIDQAPEAAVELAKVMEEMFNFWHPKVPVEVEGAVARIYSKDIEAVKGPDGRLVPWVPSWFKEES